MKEYFPYIVSVLCALISGFTSYVITRKQTKTDIQKLEKQYELDLDNEREKFKMEKEKLELEHKHQLELNKKEMENQISKDVVSIIMKEYIHSPAGQDQIRRASTKRKSF